MKVGYARTSTLEEGIDRQMQMLTDEGCELIFQETVASAVKDKPQLKRCLDSLSDGDTLVVCSLDRLGRSINYVLQILTTLKDRKVLFYSVEDRIDTRGISGLIIGNMLDALKKLKENAFRVQCEEGAARKGRKAGRKPGSLNKSNQGKPDLCRQLYENGSSISQIMHILNIRSYSTIYKYLRIAGVNPLAGEDSSDDGKRLNAKDLKKLKQDAYDDSHQLKLFK